MQMSVDERAVGEWSGVWGLAFLGEGGARILLGCEFEYPGQVKQRFCISNWEHL